MRLHLDHHTGAAGAGQTAGAGAAQAAGGGLNRIGQETGTAKDSVALSGPSAALSRLSSDRASRVQQLAGAVKSGSYNVSSAAISSALVGSSLP